ncbi:MAG: hypothetical protein ACLT3R_00685 [Roseburia sp.]
MEKEESAVSFHALEKLEAKYESGQEERWKIQKEYGEELDCADAGIFDQLCNIWIYFEL